jgi:hypothetical protein
MKILATILICLFAATAGAQTNLTAAACRHPARIMGTATVNLAPLFAWWAHQPQTKPSGTNAPATGASEPDERPLSAWKLISGTKVGEVEYSWVVDAVVYSSPTVRTNARIILKNPPAAEERAFNDLTAQLAQARQQVTNAQHTAETAQKAAKRDDDEAQRWFHSGAKNANASHNNFLRRAEQNRAAATAAQNQQRQFETLHSQLQKQLEALPSRNGKYHLVWFALEQGRTKAGVPVFDAGLVPAGLP